MLILSNTYNVFISLNAGNCCIKICAVLIVVYWFDWAAGVKEKTISGSILFAFNHDYILHVISRN